MDFNDLRKRHLDIGRTPSEIYELHEQGLNALVEGPAPFDSNVNRWKTSQAMGLIGASGNGKTSFTFYIFKEILEKKKDGYCVMFALEMSETELAEKWKKVTQGDEALAERLYIVSSHKDGKSRDLSMDGINERLNDISSIRDDRMWAFAVDHLHIIQRKGKYVELDNIVKRFTELCTEYDTFGILTSQTTKTKGGFGDVPLGMNACYGTSAMEWYMSYIYTLCQPLKRIQDEIYLPVTSWCLAKNRFQDRNDKIRQSSNELIYFVHETESYRPLTEDEKKQFQNEIPRATEERKLDTGGEDYVFNITRNIPTKDGGTFKSNIRVRGKVEDED